jgi:hypothetical protein
MLSVRLRALGYSFSGGAPAGSGTACAGLRRLRRGPGQGPREFPRLFVSSFIAQRRVPKVEASRARNTPRVRTQVTHPSHGRAKLRSRYVSRDATDRPLFLWSSIGRWPRVLAGRTHSDMVGACGSQKRTTPKTHSLGAYYVRCTRLRHHSASVLAIPSSASQRSKGTCRLE